MSDTNQATTDNEPQDPRRARAEALRTINQEAQR